MARPSPTAAVAAVGVAALGVSYLAVRTGVAERIDGAVRSQLCVGRSASTDRVVGIATDLGSVYGLTGVGGALAAAGHRRLAGELLTAGGIAWLGSQAAKPLLARPRPYEAGQATRLVAPPAGSSWPSGHAAVAVAMAATVLPELPRPARPVVVATAAAVGLSRLHVGVHHLTDLLAGFGVGLVSSASAHTLLRRLRSARRSG